MWDLWYRTLSTLCVLSMLICRMLVGWTCCHASERIGSLVLQVTPPILSSAEHVHLLRWTGVDVKSGSVYCSECNNFIYYSKLDALYLATVVAAEEKQMGVCLLTSPTHRPDTPLQLLIRNHLNHGAQVRRRSRLLRVRSRLRVKVSCFLMMNFQCSYHFLQAAEVCWILGRLVSWMWFCSVLPTTLFFGIIF